jgi:choline dehydrogenase
VSKPCLDEAGVSRRGHLHGGVGRAADTLIMRTITSGNTNAPSIMIGEKAAAMILKAAARTAAPIAVSQPLAAT